MSNDSEHTGSNDSRPANISYEQDSVILFTFSLGGDCFTIQPHRVGICGSFLFYEIKPDSMRSGIFRLIAAKPHPYNLKPFASNRLGIFARACLHFGGCLIFNGIVVTDLRAA